MVTSILSVIYEFGSIQASDQLQRAGARCLAAMHNL
jgi:hypothetical protein